MYFIICILMFYKKNFITDIIRYSYTYHWGKFHKSKVIKVTYKVVKFEDCEKSGSKPFNSLFSSTLHNTEKHTRWKNELKCNHGQWLILYGLVKMIMSITTLYINLNHKIYSFF
jgi:hypothetical protein